MKILIAGALGFINCCRKISKVIKAIKYTNYIYSVSNTLLNKILNNIICIMIIT